VDLSAVSKFASSSAGVMSDNVDLLTAPPGQYFDEAVQVAHTPLLRQTKPDDLTQIDLDVTRVNETQDVAKLAANTLQLYFKALADAADTGKTDVSTEADSIDKSLSSLKIITASTKPATGSVAAILKTLRIPLDLAQQAAVRRLITTADPDIQALTLFLQNIAAQQAEITAHAGVVLGDYFRASFDRTGDAGLQALLRARMWDQAAAVQVSVDAANRTRAAIRTIGQDHHVLADNAEHLSSATVIATLKTDAPLIQAALKPFL